MWFIIRRNSDGKYLSKIHPIIWDANLWSDEINDSESLVIGRCEKFAEKFFDKDDFDIIEV